MAKGKTNKKDKEVKSTVKESSKTENKTVKEEVKTVEEKEVKKVVIEDAVKVQKPKGSHDFDKKDTPNYTHNFPPIRSWNQDESHAMASFRSDRAPPKRSSHNYDRRSFHSHSCAPCTSQPDHPAIHILENTFHTSYMPHHFKTL